MQNYLNLNTPNRTTLELKPITTLNKSAEINSQSHHTGIETQSRQKSVFQLITPNRTTLELKLAISNNFTRSDFAPNRTTLELKLIDTL